MKKKFYFGVGSSASQIEGASYEGNKVASIWDLYDETNKISSGKIATACDSYHRYQEDIELVKELGCDVYRFSINWTRIMSGDKINQEGIDYYNNVINCCLEKGLIPFVTLYHWDLPLTLYEKGGYLNPSFPRLFEEYAKVAVDSFGDRVKNWFTFNEPQNLLTRLGGSDKKYTPLEQYQMLHNILLAHGLAYRVIKKYDPSIQVSIAYAVEGIVPYSDDLEDRKAILKRQFGVARDIPFCLSLWMDPVLKGDYPKDYYVLNEGHIPNISQEDLSIIHTGLDFIGVNLYTGYWIKSDGHGDCIEMPWPKDTLRVKDGEWAYVPQAMYWGLKNVYERYHVPLIVSESGTCVKDELINDRVHDKLRGDIISSFIEQTWKAKNEGIDIQGYFCWSLLDNVEWFRGINQRFGLVYVDFSNYQRIKKDSFYRYQKIIAKYRNDD